MKRIRLRVASIHFLPIALDFVFVRARLQPLDGDVDIFVDALRSLKRIELSSLRRADTPSERNDRKYDDQCPLQV